VPGFEHLVMLQPRSRQSVIFRSSVNPIAQSSLNSKVSSGSIHNMSLSRTSHSYLVTISLWSVLLGIAAMTGCGGGRSRPKEVWISNILASPQDYWNAEVKIVGTVQDIQVYPKGTSQGSYLLMDRNSEVIQVKSQDLPNVSDRVVVVGIVGQNSKNATIPIVVESDRQWVWMSFIYIISGVILLLMAMGIIVYRYLRLPAKHVGPRSPDSSAPAAQSAANAFGGGKQEIAAKNQSRESMGAKAVTPSKQKAETVFLDADQIAAARNSPKSITIRSDCRPR
jgi:hypothetical protein